MKRSIIALAIASLSACGGGDWEEPSSLSPAEESAPDFSLSTGKGVHIAIIDTGVRRDHRDFVGHLGPSYSFFSPLTEAQGTVGDCAPYGGHGTSVASVAAGLTWGIAKDATIYPLTAVNCAGWVYISAIVNAIDAVAASSLRPAIINLSIGGGIEAAIDAAVVRAVAAGVVVVVAAGNEAKDACLSTPARVPEAITVGASDAAGKIAYFSNVGPCVDYYLPGSGVMVASSYSSDAITVGVGTSFAAPYATGWAAKVLEILPHATPAEVKYWLDREYAKSGLPPSGSQ